MTVHDVTHFAPSALHTGSSEGAHGDHSPHRAVSDCIRWMVTAQDDQGSHGVGWYSYRMRLLNTQGHFTWKACWPHMVSNDCTGQMGVHTGPIPHSYGSFEAATDTWLLVKRASVSNPMAPSNYVKRSLFSDSTIFPLSWLIPSEEKGGNGLRSFVQSETTLLPFFLCIINLNDSYPSMRWW